LGVFELELSEKVRYRPVHLGRPPPSSRGRRSLEASRRPPPTPSGFAGTGRDERWSCRVQGGWRLKITYTWVLRVSDRIEDEEEEDKGH
jgi:hypothetical protein